MGKRKYVKPDEYYQQGPIELARFGNIIATKNNMVEADKEKYIKYLADQYPQFKSEIDALVLKITELVSKCNPLDLLTFLSSMSNFHMIGQLSEFHYTSDMINVMKSVEYIQSILVSTPNTHNAEQENDDSSIYQEILTYTMELYNKLYSFGIFWHAKVKCEDSSMDDESIKFIVESLNSSLIRGDRYQLYQIEHISKLISPHNAVLMELFNISAEEFIEGLKKIEYSLSTGIADTINDLGNQLEALLDSTDTLDIDSVLTEEQMLNLSNKFKIFIGASRNDVRKITGWPESLMQALAYKLNDSTGFFNGEYAGWPIMNLPIQRKPFICIQNNYYCFDYNSLFDNIYRVMQKTIKELKPTYADTWAQLQKEASEGMVEELLEKLLPGCATYRDNYYPKKTSLKQCDENDILVVYEDNLIIVEVKAGSFTYTPALTDYKSHIKSFKTLVEVADHQCERTYQYITKNDEAKIYDENKNLKVTLSKHKFNEIYSLCVTVDNFNEFAARAEKLSFINLEAESISLSVDDLRVYTDYFDSPLYFLHYLKQRKHATKIKQLCLNDELDHLGLYIHYNMYSKTATDFEDGSIVFFNGYREEIDNYFMTKNLEEHNYPKPKQNIPNRISEIISFLQCSDTQNKVFLSNFILDLDDNAKQQFNNAIEHLLVRQLEVGYMIPVTSVGDVVYFLYVKEEGVRETDKSERDKYVDSNMLYCEYSQSVCICLNYDSSTKLIDLEYEIRYMKDIPCTKIEELRELGKRHAARKVENYKWQKGISKVGRNDMCPCGSGKKYKKCCGR